MENRREHRTTVTLGARAIDPLFGFKSEMLHYILGSDPVSTPVLSGRCRFAKPDIYEYLEERRVFYAIRLPSNKVLQYEIAPLLIRPVGRPPKRR